jgi:hypothetical protein
VNEVVARFRRACQRGLCTLGLRAKGVELSPAVLERETCPLQLVQRALTRDNAIVVQFRQHAQRSCGLPDLADVCCRQQQPQVPALTQFVDVDEPVAQFGPAGRFLAFQIVHALRVSRELRRDLRAVGDDLSQFLGLELPVDLEFAKVAEQGAFLRCERVRFLLQGLKTFGRAPGEGFRACAVGRLREKPGCESREDNGRETSAQNRARRRPEEACHRGLLDKGIGTPGRNQ